MTEPLSDIVEARIYSVHQVVDKLNQELEKYKDIQFTVSERRTSLDSLNRNGIIDYAKIDKNNKLIVALIKNLDDLPESTWRKMVKDLPKTLESKMGGQDINTRYSWSKGEYLDNYQLTTDLAAEWGSTSNSDFKSSLRNALDSVDTANVNALYDLKDDNDPQVADNGARAANFIRYIKSGPTVVVPKVLWRQMGWSSTARENNITIKYPEAGADVLAILRSDFEKVVGLSGFTVTEESSPLLNKPRTAYSGDSKSSAVEDYEYLIKVIGAYVERTDEYINAKDAVNSIEVRNDESMKKDAEEELSRVYKEQFQAAVRNGPYAGKYATAKKLVDEYEPAEDYVTNHYRETASKDLDIILNKIIEIRKHPRQDYYIIKNVSGTTIPTY